MLIKRLIIFIGIITCFGTVYAQDIEENLERDATAMINAILSEDYGSYVKYSYPKAVEVFGGSEMLIKMTKENKAALKSAGMILTEATFDHSAPIIETETSFQTIVAFNYITDIAGNNYKGQNFLLGMSSDKGQNWTFLELETFDKESISDFVPEFSDELTFPTIVGAEYIEKK